MQRPVFFEQFELQALNQPDQAAFEGPAGAMSYAGLSRESNRIAQSLVRAGLRPQQGEVVALHLEPGADYVAALMGVAKAGAVFMPLPPDLPRLRLESVLAKARCRWVITAGGEAPDLSSIEPLPAAREALAPLRLIRPVDWAGEDGLIAPPVSIRPTDPCYVIYTSGSTGEPKAILGTHRGLSHFLRWELAELALNHQVRGSWLAPITFDVSLRDILVPLMAGGTVCHPGEAVRTQPHLLLAWLSASRISLTHCVPTLLRLMNRALEEAPAGPPVLHSLRHLLVAGEPLLACDVAAWRRLTGSDASVLNLYGPSETTLAKLFLRVGDVSEEDRSVLPIGRPLPNTTVHILQDGRACATGEIGEICIATPYRSLGYLHEPALTAASFVVNPLTRDPADILYRSGDLGRLLPDGTVQCMGRQDGQVKLNGVRIELAEIEAVLRKLPGVDQTACALHSVRPEHSMLVAYYSRPDAGAPDLDLDLVRRHLEAHLPAAMMPHRVMRLGSLPTTVSGKVNRKALPKPREAYYGDDGFVAAATPTEHAVARIWGELMELEAVGVTTPFQTLGGDSLRAIRSLMRVYQDCGVEVSLKDFYRLGTVRALAAHIEGQRGATPATALTTALATAPTLARVPDSPSYPATAGQERLWRLHRMGIAPTAYNLPTAYEVRGPLDVQRLTQALDRVIQRHESLRTVFLEVDGRAHQRVLARIPAPLVLHDLQADADHADARAQALAQADESTAFDLEHGPLLRLTVLRLPDAPGHDAAPASHRHVLLFNIHHIISDVWSLGVMARELSEAYAALEQARQPSWLPLTLQQRDVGHWQAQRMALGQLEVDRQHWLERFASAPAPLQLPTDRPRPSAQTFRGGTRRRRLSAATSSALRRLAQAQGCTLFALLQALVKVQLHRYTGQSDLVIGTPVAGRDHADLQDQIGYYVNVLALRDTVQGPTPFRSFLAECASRAQASIAHQAWPFDQLVAELDLPRDMSRSPLFDVMVVVDTFEPSSLELPGLAVVPWGRDNAWNFSRFDLVFHFQSDDDAGEFVLDLNYNSDLFDIGRIDRACGHFETLAASAAAAADMPLGDLPMLTPEERGHLDAWAYGERITRPPHSIVSLLDDVAQAHGDRTAVVSPAGHWTHAQLQAASTTAAAALRVLPDWEPGQCVAVWARRSWPSLVAMLAIMRAGGVYLPLDPAYPKARLDRILQASGCRLLLADDAADARTAALTTQHTTTDATADATAHTASPSRAGPMCRSLSELMTSAPVERLSAPSGGMPLATKPSDVAPDSAAYMIFTSGSTGQPKGVVCRHDALVNMSRGQIEAMGLGPTDRVMQFASPAFDASLANIFMALFCGAAVVLPSARALESSADFLQELSDTRTTAVTLPPSFLRALDRLPMPGLRVLITAGEPAVAADLEHYRTHHSVFNAYGPTEATVCATVHAVAASDSGRPRVPIGRPLPNLEVRVLDARGQAVPIGVAGQLHIGGAGVASGYHGDPTLTAARFLSLEGLGKARFYATGDRVCWLEGGALDFIGRDDDQVKVSGHRIELGDVEQALRDVDGIADAAVVAVRRPDGATALAAYFCPQARLEWWPSVAEFYVYDDVVYTSMAQDEARNDRYRAAFARHLKGKVVLDIGTGPVAILSRLAIEAGAAHVYAVDLLEATAAKARRTVERLGLSDRITVIHGDARTLRLPQPADVCISEIVGAIGGSEGSADIINRARHLLSDPGAMLPRRSVTRLAAVNLPENDIAWGFSDVAAHYVERIFAEVGRPFDLRLCVKNLPRSALVSTTGVLEDLDYTQAIDLESSHVDRLTVSRSGPVNGLLAWLELHVDEDQIVDILDNPGSWLPVFVALDQPLADALEGDEIELTVERRLAANGLNPDFLISGRHLRRGQVLQHFRSDSLHDGRGFRTTSTHARLFPADARVPRIPGTTAQDVRAQLALRLPAHAVPAYLMALERLPTTVHGKVDRQALPNPQGLHRGALPDGGEGGATAGSTANPSALESMIARVWAATLGRESVSPEDDFFMLGGDSIRAIQIVSRLRRLGIRTDVQDLFQNPTVAGLARGIQRVGRVAPQHPVSGPIRLSPIQSWLLGTAGRDPHRFLQALSLTSPQPVDPAAVQAAVRSLWVHHDGLRLEVSLDDTSQDITPQARLLPPDDGTGPMVLETDITALDEATAGARIDEAVERLYAGLRLNAGCPLFGAVHVRGQRRDRIVLAAHHAVVDRVSWDILLEDFEAALEAHEAGQPALLPFKSSSVLDVADAHRRVLDSSERLEPMRRHARSLDGAAPPWMRVPPEDAPGPVHTESARLSAVASQHLGAASRTPGSPTLEDRLLAALALALRQTTGSRSTLIDLESHGRTLPASVSGLVAELDISRTVGWFTTFAPVQITVEAQPSLAEMAEQVQGVRQALPDGGWSYLLATEGHASADSSSNPPRPQARVGFNHLGSLGSASASGRFQVDWEAPGRTIGEHTASAHALQVLTLESEGVIEISISGHTPSMPATEVTRILRAIVSILEAVEEGSGYTYAVSADELDDLLG